MLFFYIGKCLNSAFLRNCLSLRYDNWQKWWTRWADEDHILLKVKVIFDLCSRSEKFCHPSALSNIFSKVTWQIEAMFPYWAFFRPGKDIFLGGLCHMTKMAAMPIYGKIPSNVFFLNLKAYDLETLYVALETLALQIFFKDHLALTLT